MQAISSSLLSLVGLSSLLGVRSAPQGTPELEASSWYAQVSEDIRRVEYAFGPMADEPGVFSAPNRAQDFRSRVSGKGLEVFPRENGADGEDAAWKLELPTKSFGRPGSIVELGPASISSEARRVELDHGLLREWFENGEDGLEHGYEIATRPPGVEPLWIELAFSGDLALRIDEGARSGALVDATGEIRLSYLDLAVFDAEGRELEAQLAPSLEGVGISIEDAGAAYPLTVDPVLTGPVWTAESDQANANFGYSVAPAGDVNGDGYSDVIVGAPWFNNAQTNEGRAFVYLGSASGPSPSATWTAESDQAGAWFAYSVASAGDVDGDGYSDLIVGARLYDDGGTNEGRAFVYPGNAGYGGWTHAAQQRRTTDAAAISLLGAADSTTHFRIRLSFERSLAGFEWSSPFAPAARLEWQIAPLGVPLGGIPLESGAEQPITGLPLTFNEQAELIGQTPGPYRGIWRGPYHWRARLRTNNPLLPVTPWVSMPGNHVTEAKLRPLL